MSWYLQKNDGETYGPVELDELEHWAAEGRIAPQDKLSQDNEHWAAAPDAAELGMDWVVNMPDQPAYGPLHLRAFLDLIAGGFLAANSRIQHRRSGKSVVLGDALLHALIPEIQGLQVHAEALQGCIDDQKSKFELIREELETDALRLEAKLIKENELAQRCAELEGKAKDLEELSSNIESTKGEIVGLAESHDQRVSELEQEIRDIEAKRRAAEETSATRLSAIENLEKRQKALEERLAAGDQESKELTDRANALEKKAETLREERQMLEESSAIQLRDLSVAKNALQAETERWQQAEEAARISAEEQIRAAREEHTAASIQAEESAKAEIAKREEAEKRAEALQKTCDQAKAEAEIRVRDAEDRRKSAEKALNDLKASAQKAEAPPGGNGKDNVIASGKKVVELEQALEKARTDLQSEVDRARTLERQVAELMRSGQGSKIALGIAPSPEMRPETGRIDQLKELSLQNDLMTKEIAKWKTMYEEERRAGRELENRMNERIEESKRSEADALVHQEDTARRLHHMELNYKKLTDFTEAGGSEDELKAQFALLITSHNELSQSYDTLLTQLHQKTREIDRMMAERSQIENEATDRVQAMEAITKREQDEAARMRQQFVRIQETHLQLVKSYREMNDRIIRYRQQQDPDAAPQQTHPEGTAPVTGPRIRLN